VYEPYLLRLTAGITGRGLIPRIKWRELRALRRNINYADDECFRYRKVLSDNGSIWLSIIGNISQFNLISQSEAQDLPVANFPYSSSGIPFAARRFHPALQVNFSQPHVKSNDLAVLDCFGRRLSERFFDDEFYCFEALALFGVIAIADANQLFAVMSDEFLCVFLNESQCPPSLHKRPSCCWRKPRLIDYC
jgi:hypothetical protein